jgi:hypothetical protein
VSPWAAWGAIALVYAALFAWYQGFRAPLTADEVAAVVARQTERGVPPEQVERLRRFLASDDGGDFVMVNAIELRTQPLAVEGVPEGESSQQMLDRYMAYMWPELLARACHPILAGPAAADALDVWGIAGGERWTTAGLMRYRSRRDLVEIAANDAFRGAHLFKTAAMQKTIAFPITPFLNLGDPRLAAGLALFSLGALAHLRLRPTRR